MRASSVFGSGGAAFEQRRGRAGDLFDPRAGALRHRRRGRTVFAEVRARDGVARLGEDGVHVCRRQPEKRARRGGRDVSGAGAAILALGGGVLSQHLDGGEHLAQAAVVGDPFARCATQALEEAPQQARVPPVERGERGGERVPALVTPPDGAILIELEVRSALERTLQLGLDRGEHELVEIDHQHRRVQRQRQQLLVEIGERVGGEGLARLQHHLEPQAEARRIEALVGARRGAAPEILVEHPFELLRRRHRHELAGVLEPDVIDELQQGRRRQRLHRPHELRLVEQAREQRSRTHRQLVVHERKLVGRAGAR